MKRLESLEDEMQGVVTYELSGGRRVTLNAHDVQEHGAMVHPCLCLECRLRAAIGGSETVPIEVAETLAALGNVTAELLAHTNTRNAKYFANKLLEERKKWQKHPRVAVQQPPQGHG